MILANHIWLYSLMLTPWICFGQGKRLDSLRNALPGLSNSSRIGCLNDISAEYILEQNKDSAAHYAILAETEARAGNDAYGIAISLVSQTKVVYHFDKDFNKIESMGREALRWFEKSSKKSGIESAYDLLWVATFAQGQFEEAIGFIQKKMDYCNQVNNFPGMWDAVFSLGIVYKEAGDYERSFRYYQESYQLAQQANDPMILSPPLYGIGDLFMRIEDYTAALPYYRQAFQIERINSKNLQAPRDWSIWANMQFAEVFSNLNQFDSAWHYYKLFKPDDDDLMHFRVYLVSTGECFFLQKKYQPALDNFIKSLAYNLKMNDRNQVMRIMLDIAKTHNALQNDTAALRYAREGLNLALQTRARQFMRDGYKVFYSVYDRRAQADSANLYFRRYTAMKDSVANDQVKVKFATYNYDQKIELLNKEKEIQHTKLQKEALLKNIFIGGVLVLLLLGVIIFRNIMLKRKNEAHLRELSQNELQLQKLESEKIKAEWQQQAIELELQALRAQMNPHFIFNSLNSINGFILQNNKTQASEHVTKFSKLVRLILQNSQVSLISLENELEALQLYLELQAIRFDHQFEFRIHVEDELDVSAINVPPLIIQPYVENAIWHGLLHKDEKGHLDIELYRDGDELCCKITDDGVGRKKASELKSKLASQHKSMGMQITADRMAILQQKKATGNYIRVTDLVLSDGNAGGTEVLLKIPLGNV